jgi:hypothetical protein
MQQTAPIAENRFEAPTMVPELLLIEVLKLHLTSTPADQTGWLHALGDPVLAPALAAIHASPERKWNLVSLAKQAQASVTLLGSDSVTYSAWRQSGIWQAGECMNCFAPQTWACRLLPVVSDTTLKRPSAGHSNAR